MGGLTLTHALLLGVGARTYTDPQNDVGVRGYGDGMYSSEGTGVGMGLAYGYYADSGDGSGYGPNGLTDGGGYGDSGDSADGDGGRAWLYF